MSVVGHPKERAWEEGAAATITLMGSINLATAQLVATFRLLIDTEGWHGGGIQTVEHWVTWQAAIAPR